MAFPVIASSAATSTEDATTMVVNMPSGITAGDLLIIFAAFDTLQTPSVSGWTTIETNAGTGNACTQAIFAKIAAGGDTATISASAQDGVCIAVRITGHGVFGVAHDISKGTAALNTISSVFPPACTPAAGVAADYLWLEMFSADDDDDTDEYWSTNFTGVAQEQSASTASSCMVALAYRELNASTLTPGAMHMLAFEESVAQTLAIPPALDISETAMDIDDDLYTGVDIPQRGRARAWERRRR